MWLIGCLNTSKIEQSWECTFLKLYDYEAKVKVKKNSSLVFRTTSYHSWSIQHEPHRLCSAVARCQILGGHTVNRDVGYGVHSYINLKILGGHVPVCPPYKYGPELLFIHQNPKHIQVTNCEHATIGAWPLDPGPLIIGRFCLWVQKYDVNGFKIC